MALVLIPFLGMSTTGLPRLRPAAQGPGFTRYLFNPVLRRTNSEGPSKLPKATQVNGRVGTQTRFYLTGRPSFFLYGVDWGVSNSL